jgi:hypothetical protein
MPRTIGTTMMKSKEKQLHKEYLKAIKDKKPETLIRQLKEKWIKAVENAKKTKSENIS